MKIMVMSKTVAGASREDLRTHALAESRAVWNLYEQGICREFYTGVSRDVCKSGHGSAVSTLVGEYLSENPSNLYQN
jgi:hypothetical protein